MGKKDCGRLPGKSILKYILKTSGKLWMAVTKGDIGQISTRPSLSPTGEGRPGTDRSTQRQINQEKELELRPGLKIGVVERTLAHPVSTAFDLDQDAPLYFCYLCSGEVNSSIPNGLRSHTTIKCRHQTHYISFFPKSKGISELLPGSPLQILQLQMDPLLLNRLLQGYLDQVPSDFRPVAEASCNHHYFRPGHTTPAMNAVIHQIVTCSYTGLTKRLFLESKALELIALQLEHSVISPKDDPSRPSLRPADIERLHQVKDLVRSHMRQPLSLMELARRTGLNEFKLKRGFRHLFGATVFGYLHQLRMEKSRMLLEDGRLNVKEVSYAVGYMNQGRFSDAFKKQYGVRPSRYRDTR